MNENPSQIPPQTETAPTATPSTTVETVEWFDSLPTPEQKPKKKHVRMIIILIAATLITGGAGLWFALSQTKQCLTTNDLKTLTGISDIDPVTSPNIYFFSYPVEFQAGSTSYNIVSEPTGPQLVSKLSDFYKSHLHSSMIFTLTSDYFLENDKTLAEQRLTTLKGDLTNAGIPADAIRISDPVQNDPENDTEQATTASIAITSDASCR